MINVSISGITRDRDLRPTPASLHPETVFAQLSLSSLLLVGQTKYRIIIITAITRRDRQTDGRRHLEGFPGRRAGNNRFTCCYERGGLKTHTRGDHHLLGNCTTRGGGTRSIHSDRCCVKVESCSIIFRSVFVRLADPWLAAMQFCFSLNCLNYFPPPIISGQELHSELLGWSAVTLCAKCAAARLWEVKEISLHSATVALLRSRSSIK